jgi:hypothetical protein
LSKLLPSIPEEFLDSRFHVLGANLIERYLKLYCEEWIGAFRRSHLRFLLLIL